MNMVRFRAYGRTFYTSWAEANKVRRSNDRIYYAPDLGYYIVRPSVSLWDRLFR